MTNTLQQLGYPTHDQLAAMELTGEEFFDIVMWMIKAQKRFGDGWLWRGYLPTGWEVIAFIRGSERTASA